MRFSLDRILPSTALCASLVIAPAAFHGQDAAKPTTAQPAAAGPHYPTTEELRHTKAMGGPELSPDGTQVLFSVTESTADGAATHLWIVPTSGAEKSRQLTFSPPADKRGERAPQWAPDGSAIYFTAKRGEHSQLFRLDMRGGDAAPYDLKVMAVVDESKEKNAIPPPGSEKKDDKAAEKKDDTKSADKKDESKPADKDKKPDTPEPLPFDIGGYAPSPDGKWLAVWAHDPETPGEKKQKDAKADAEWVNHSKHATRLYLAALKPDGSIDGALKPVAVAPDVRSATWSPASDRLLVQTEKPNDEGDLEWAGSDWIVDISALDKPAKLDGVPASVSFGATWRPDGGEIVFSAQTPEDAPPGYDELFALAVSGASAPGASIPGTARRLSAGFKGQLNGGILYYANDGGLIADASIATHTTPVRLALDAGRPPAPIDLGSPVVTGLNTNRKQTGWVWMADGGGMPLKLCFAAHLGDACSTLQTPAMEPEHLRSVKPELVHWKSGPFEVEGLMYLPDHPTGSAANSGKIPLVVDVHGGPFGAFEDRNDHFAAFLVGHGWAVFRPNPRGSSNYGVKFGAANKNDLGGGDYDDIMAGVDAVLAKYPLDSTRMALIGYSYGGEMAGFVEGKTTRFKAIVSGAPVIDQFSEYGTESGSWYDRWYFGKPWEHLADAWKQSPLAGAAKAKTPFLLLQGESDTTDPVGQAQEMYRALRQEGVPVELVTYPRENHGPLAGGIFGAPSPEPWHGYDARQRLVEFLSKYIGETEKNL
jgi:dipeptidyl aminopeptidase/acylaminoacyl peptidase